jgi:hypothetical protein
MELPAFLLPLINKGDSWNKDDGLIVSLSLINLEKAI